MRSYAICKRTNGVEGVTAGKAYLIKKEHGGIFFIDDDLGQERSFLWLFTLLGGADWRKRHAL